MTAAAGAHGAPTASPRKHSTYRPDIDGLRAIAVVAVIVYHAQSRALPGGFTGVDVFFVISGFLISGIILQGLRHGAFSITEFYARRIRRIFPALSLVLFACLLIGWFLLFPADYMDLGGDAAASAGFVANILLWAQTSYFGPDVSTKPLLHLWSLGVEEQYYLVWPMLLLAMWQTRHRLLPIIAVLFASFALNIMYSTSDPRAAFFSPVSRVWELALGSLIAYASIAHGEPAELFARVIRSIGVECHALSVACMRELCAWTGLIFIGIAFAQLNEKSVFPGYWVLLPTAGTALLICAGPSAWFNRVVLANRAFVGIGLISYPLYLWHWPVLAVIRIQLAEISRVEKVGVLLGAFVAAYITYEAVEIRIRKRGGAKAVVILCAIQTLLLLTGLVIVQQRGFPQRYDEIQRRIVSAKDTETRKLSYGEGTCFLDLDQRVNGFPPYCYQTANDVGSMRRVLLWGDSFAAHLSPGIRATKGERTAMSQLTSSGCAPIVGHVDTQRAICTRLNQDVVNRIGLDKPDVVILAARWNFYDYYREIETTIKVLKALGVPLVVVVGSSAQFSADVPRLLIKVLDRGVVPTRLPPKDQPRLENIDSALRTIAERSGAEFVSPLSAQCDAGGCLVALDTAARSITTWDDGHLTKEGSAFVAERLLQPYLNP